MKFWKGELSYCCDFEGGGCHIPHEGVLHFSCPVSPTILCTPHTQEIASEEDSGRVKANVLTISPLYLSASLTGHWTASARVASARDTTRLRDSRTRSMRWREGGGRVRVAEYSSCHLKKKKNENENVNVNVNEKRKEGVLLENWR